MIQIVKGSFGRVMPDGTVQATKPGSAPFSYDKETEERLVAQGVAVFVDDPAPDPTPEVLPTLPEYDDTMKLAELKRIAEVYGVNTDGMKTKEAVLAALDVAAGNAPDGV